MKGHLRSFPFSPFPLYIFFFDHLLVQFVYVHLCLKFQGVMSILVAFNCLQGVEVVVVKHTTMAT
jgi:hypothetical protein